jgi:hypothetical protein
LRKAEDVEALTRTKESDDAICFVGEDLPYFEEASAALYKLGRFSNTADTLLRIVVRAGGERADRWLFPYTNAGPNGLVLISG